MSNQATRPAPTSGFGPFGVGVADSSSGPLTRIRARTEIRIAFSVMRIAFPPRRKCGFAVHPSPPPCRVSRAATLAWVCLALACSKPPAPIVVRNPEYLVLRPIARLADAEHTIPIELPYAGAGYGFASAAALLDLSAFQPGAAGSSGGRAGVGGEATFGLPLPPEGARRLEEWSSQAKAGGQYLGIFLRGKLIAAPEVRGPVGGGIPLRVANKIEGDRVLR